MRMRISAQLQTPVGQRVISVENGTVRTEIDQKMWKAQYFNGWWNILWYRHACSLFNIEPHTRTPSIQKNRGL